MKEVIELSKKRYTLENINEIEIEHKDVIKVSDSSTGEEKEIKTVSRAEVATVFAYMLGVGDDVLDRYYSHHYSAVLERLRKDQAATIVRYNLRERSRCGVNDTFLKVVMHPFATVEYILVPLLMRCLKVSDELAASGTTRGMERENKRHCLLKIEFDFKEYMTVIGVVIYVVFLLLLDRSSIGQNVFWR